MFKKLLLAVIVLVLIYVIFFKSSEKMTMEIKAEKLVPGVNVTGYVPAGVTISTSKDPRFNFMTVSPEKGIANSNVYAMGQVNDLWQTWRQPYSEEADAALELESQQQLEKLKADKFNQLGKADGNVYALGQMNGNWDTWRRTYQEEPFTSKAKRMKNWVTNVGNELMTTLQKGWSVQPKPPSRITPYGPIAMGTNQRSFIIGNTTALDEGPADWTSEERMENKSIFRGPPGYDITLTTPTLQENLNNQSGWLTLKTHEYIEKSPAEIAEDESKYVGILYNP